MIYCTKDSLLWAAWKQSYTFCVELRVEHSHPYTYHLTEKALRWVSWPW